MANNLTITLNVKKQGFENIDELAKRMAELGVAFQKSSLADFSKKMEQVANHVKDINKNIGTLEQKITKVFAKATGQIKNSGVDSLNRSFETITKQADIFATRLVGLTAVTVAAGLNIGQLIQTNTTIASIGIKTVENLVMGAYNTVAQLFNKNLSLFVTGVDKILNGVSGLKFAIMDVNIAFKSVLSGVLSIGQSLVGSVVSMSAIRMFASESTILLQRAFGFGQQNMGILARSTRLIKLFDDSLSNSFGLMGSMAKIGTFTAISTFVNPILGLPGLINSVTDVVAVGIKKSRLKLFSFFGSSQSKFILIVDKARELAFKTLPTIFKIAKPIFDLLEKLKAKDISNFFKGKLLETGLAKSENQLMTKLQKIKRYISNEIVIASNSVKFISSNIFSSVKNGTISTAKIIDGTLFSSVSKVFNFVDNKTAYARAQILHSFDSFKEKFGGIFSIFGKLFSPLKSLFSLFTTKKDNTQEQKTKKENIVLEKQKLLVDSIAVKKASFNSTKINSFAQASEKINLSLVKIEKTLSLVGTRLVSFQKTGTGGVVQNVERAAFAVENTVQIHAKKIQKVIQNILTSVKFGEGSKLNQGGNLSRAITDFFNSIEASLTGRNVKIKTFKKQIDKVLLQLLKFDNTLTGANQDQARKFLLSMIKIPNETELKKVLEPIITRIQKHLDEGTVKGKTFGAKISNLLVQGIKGKIPDIEKAIKEISEIIAAFFPRSPAKKGALRGLTTMGKKIVFYIAQGMLSAKDLVVKSTGVIAELIARFFPRSLPFIGALMFLPKMGFKIVFYVAQGISAAAKLVSMPVSAVAKLIAGGFSGISSILFGVGKTVINSLISGVTSSFSLLSSTFSKVKSIISTEVEKNKNLFLLSARVGIDAKEISLISNSFEVLGAQGGELDFTLARINEQLSKNNVEDFRKFASLGIDLRKVKQEANPVIETLLGVSEVIKKFGINSKEASDAISLLGLTSSSNLVSVLAQGREQISKTIIEVKNLGGSVSNEIAEKSFQLSTIQKKITVFFESLKREFLSAFFEIAEKANFTKYIQENKLEITAFVKTIANILANFADLITEFVSLIVKNPQKAFEILKESINLFTKIVFEKVKAFFLSSLELTKNFFSAVGEFVYGFSSDVAPKLFDRFLETMVVFFGELRIFLAKNFPTISDIISHFVESSVDLVIASFKGLLVSLPKLGTKIIDTVFGEGATQAATDKIADFMYSAMTNAIKLVRSVLPEAVSNWLGLRDLEPEKEFSIGLPNLMGASKEFADHIEGKRVKQQVKPKEKTETDTALEEARKIKEKTKQLFLDLVKTIESTGTRLSENSFAKILTEGLEKSSEHIEKIKKSLVILENTPEQKEKIEEFKRENLAALDEIEKKLGTGVTGSYRKLIESLSPDNYKTNLESLRAEAEKTAESLHKLGESSLNIEGLKNSADDLAKFLAEIRARTSGNIVDQNNFELIQLQEKHAKEREELENFLVARGEQEKEAARRTLADLQSEEEQKKIAEFAARATSFYSESASSIFGGLASTLEQISGTAKNSIKSIFIASKAAAIAQATMDVASAFTKTLGAQGVYGLAQAGIVTAMATAKLGQIIGTTLGFSKGGHVNIGTTGTADDVLARLSKGEFVIPANRVKEWGLPRLEGIRKGEITPENIAQKTANSLPSFKKRDIPKTSNFSMGGLFTGQKQQQQQQKIEITQANFVDPSLFANFLQSQAGKNLFFNMIQDNPELMRRAIT